MKATRRFLQAAVILTLAASASTALSVECVRPSGAGRCFPTIQEGVDAASPGETVAIFPGTYWENVVVATPGVTLRGMGLRPQDVTVRSGYGAGIPLDVTVGGAGVSVLNLNTFGGTTGIRSLGAGTRLVNVVVSGTSAEGVYLESPGNVVRNCIIRNTGSDGLTANSSANEDLLVLNTLVRTVRSSGVNIGGDRARVIGGRFTGTGQDGIYIDMNNSLVRWNRVSRSGATGLQIANQYGRILGNRVEGSRNNGIAGGGNFAAVRGNIARFSGAAGFDLWTANPGGSEVVNNVAEGGAAAGFDGTFNVPAAFTGNLALDNLGAGFLLGGTGGALFADNAAAGNGAGVSPIPAAFQVAGDGHTLARNVADANNGDGFLVDGVGHTLRRNVAVNNRRAGIIAAGTGGHLLEDNLARRNVGTGIAVSGADGVTLLRNVARGNDPDFCDEGTGTVLGAGVDANSFGTTCP